MTFDVFKNWLNELDYSTITATPIEFRLDDFEETNDFAKCMFLSGERFLKEEDIVVRYCKPYNEDKSGVTIMFQIVRSKAKMFYNYLKKTDTFITCSLTTNKEINEFIKFFNSLGVKGEGMENLISKETDYSQLLKEGLEEYKRSNPNDNDASVTATITMYIDNDKECPMLFYEFEHNDHVLGTEFKEVKDSVKTDILKIKD